MESPLALHLNWDDEKAADAKLAVAELVQTPGWEYVLEALELRVAHLTQALANEPPTDQGATYADRLAEIRATGQLPGIVAGIVAKGEQAEARLRELVAA